MKETSYLITSAGAFIDKQTKEKAVIINYAAYDKIRKLMLKGEELGQFLGVNINDFVLDDLKEIIKNLRGKSLLIKTSYELGSDDNKK